MLSLLKLTFDRAGAVLECEEFYMEVHDGYSSSGFMDAARERALVSTVSYSLRVDSVSRSFRAFKRSEKKGSKPKTAKKTQAVEKKQNDAAREQTEKENKETPTKTPPAPPWAKSPFNLNVLAKSSGDAAGAQEAGSDGSDLRIERDSPVQENFSSEPSVTRDEGRKTTVYGCEKSHLWFQIRWRKEEESQEKDEPNWECLGDAKDQGNAIAGGYFGIDAIRDSWSLHDNSGYEQ
ncbi:hypothetical protein C8J56DRAFT_898393 [Mycena floridula]|nr:hypothetical protein C8J56DRAFT_898393 [Mycena floridula]